MMTDAEASKEDGTIDYLGVILSRWWLVLLGTIVCGVAAAGVSLTLPNEYEASAMLLVSPPQFKTTLNPGVFPAQMYKRILENKGLMSQVLAKMEQKHSEDFENSTVEGLSGKCQVELEIAEREGAEISSPLLVLSVRDENPAYAMEIANIWAEEFIALNRRLQKTRTAETDLFVSKQFNEAEKKLTDAEEAVTNFNDEAQIEALSQQIMIVSEQANLLFGRLEAQKEELAREKQELTTLDERIGAVEINGKWLCELAEGEVDLSKMNSFQKGVATELLKIARLYQQSTESLAALSTTADVETLRKRLSSYRSMLVEKDPYLETTQARRKSLEAALSALSDQMATTERLIILKQSLPDDVLWGKMLGAPSRKDAQKLARIQISSEILNPAYVQLGKQTIALKEELEKAMSEEKHITQKIPQLEEEVKKFESLLRIQEKKQADLRVWHDGSKRAYESRYADYIRWLSEGNKCRIKIAELEHNVEMLEGRHKKRLSQMRTMSTDMNKKQDRLTQLERGIEVAKHAYEMFKNKVEEARIASARETEDVRLVSSAIKPGKKVAPQRSLIAIVAAIVGFLLSSLTVVLFDYRAQFAKRV